MARRRTYKFVRRAMTIVEIIIAVSIMSILFAVILPQFRNMYNSWDSQKQRGEIVQNARVLLDCLSRSLASAVQITSVSMPDDALGYIEFKKNDGNTYRIDISAENYIQYGPSGNLSDFAGPVSQLQFQCYGLEDMATTTMEPDEIRLVKVSTVIYNPEDPLRTQTYSNQVFIETNAGVVSHLLAWYKFDEDAGIVATDSSRYRRHGQLINMAGAEWADGYVGGGLRFDGAEDYVSFDIQWESPSATFTAWACLDSVVDAAEILNINEIFGIRLDYQDWSPGVQAFFYIGDNLWETVWAGSSYYSGTGWHHFAYVVDSEALEHRLYVDGNLKKTSTMPTPVVLEPRPTENSHIGRHAIIDKHEFYFNGIIDDVRIYDIALTEEEVQSIGPPAPIHYWALDETDATMLDSIGDMDGTCKGNVETGELSFRDRFVNCVYLKGNGSWIDLGSDAPLNGLDLFSVSAWIKPQDKEGQAWIIGRNDNTCGWSFGITDSTIILRIWDKGGGSLEVPCTLAMDQWCHVAVVFDSNNGGLFYVNGEFAGLAEFDKKPSNGTAEQSWAIGVCDKEGYFKGHIDEVKIFDCELTESQVKITAGLAVSTDPYLDSEIRP